MEVLIKSNKVVAVAAVWQKIKLGFLRGSTALGPFCTKVFLQEVQMPNKVYDTVQIKQ